VSLIDVGTAYYYPPTSCFLGKIFYKSAFMCRPYRAPNIIVRLTQGGASLALGWYVTPRWGFCRFAAVGLVDIMDGGCLNFAPLAFLPKNLSALLGVLAVKK